MKIITSLYMLFIFSIHCFSQPINFNVRTTGILKEKLRYRTTGTLGLGKDADYTYFLCTPYCANVNQITIGKEGNFYLQKCDREPKVINKVPINLNYKGKERLLEGVYMNGDKFLIFTSFQNQKDKKHYLFVQNINKETLQQDDSLKLIGEIDYSEYSKYNRTDFTYRFSEDKSKILVFYSLCSKENKTLKSGIYVYNSNLNLLWKNDDDKYIPEGETFNFSNFWIDNEGSVYILGRIFKTFDDFHKALTFSSVLLGSEKLYTYKPNYTYQLVKCFKDKSEAMSLSLPGKYITSMTISPSGKGVVACAGIYSAPSTISAKGCFTFNADIKANKINNLEVRDFGLDMLKNALTDRELKNFRDCVNNENEWDPYTYLFSKVKTRENGKKYVVAQQFISGERRINSGKNVIYYITLIYNNLLIMNLDKDGKLEKIEKIEKNQYVLSDDQNCSYISFDKGDNLYFAFMEIFPKHTLLKNAKVGDTYLVKLTPSGKQEKVILENTTNDNDRLMVTSSAINLGSGQIIYSDLSALGTKYEYKIIKINE